MSTVAIVPAAGKGMRMGADKALLDLDGRSAIACIADTARDAGVDDLLVVRRAGAAPLPDRAGGWRTVAVDGAGDMADSLRAAAAALPSGTGRVVVLPVDHALVAADTVAAVAAAVARPDTAIALPLFRGRPGHPVALRAAVFAELRQGGTLRDVVRRDPARVRAVPTANPWVLADLDRPEDLRAARAALAALPHAPVELMFRHRSHRAYAATPLAPGQLERLVDAARHASTSSFIQAYAVVAVTDPARKAEAARLCADQAHIHEAPVFLGICADLEKLRAACAQQGAAIQAHSLELFLQATVDAALLGQNLALAAESEGLGICMLGAARNHPIELARLLGLPDGCFVVFGMTIGHPTDDPVPRERMPLAGVLHRETYAQDGTAAALAGADAAMRRWAEACNERGGYLGRPVNTEKGWADRMARLWGPDSSYVRARASLRQELRQLGFGLE
ncbi:MAG: NTP transferase domain-containing protein [Planctomycetota bacterium]